MVNKHIYRILSVPGCDDFGQESMEAIEGPYFWQAVSSWRPVEWLREVPGVFSPLSLSILRETIGIVIVCVFGDVVTLTGGWGYSQLSAQRTMQC